MKLIRFLIFTILCCLCIAELIHIDKVQAGKDDPEEVFYVTEYVTVTTNVTIQQLLFESATVTTDVTLTTENIVIVTESATSMTIDTVTSTIFSLYTMGVVETETLTVTEFINTEQAKGNYVQIEYEYAHQ